jgi:hypothetical protein
MGAPVHLEGRRGGRPLRPRDVTTAVDRHPEALPFLLPDPERENPLEAARKLFQPPETGTDGLWIGLVETTPDTSLEVDEDTLEALRALGYVGR